MKPCLPRTLSVLLVLLAAAIPALADVKLHGLFTDHMVLQRDASVPIWGWADEGEKVTVEFQGQKVSTKARQGKWMVRLKNLKTGPAATLKVTGKNTLTLNDVLVGEVWIASGQSNMEWSMRASHDPTNEIAKTTNPLLRLYTVPKLKSNQPVDNVPASWQPCNPETTPGFSAVAYYFARDLAAALKVPVGIIHTSWGGSPCEVWIREGVLAGDKEFKRDILDPYARNLPATQAALAKWREAKAEAARTGARFTQREPRPWQPSELYNGMIAPLIPYAIRGAIWYQGESNASRAHQYRRLFPTMVQNWRDDWDQGDFTFLQVQLAPFKDYKPQPGDSDWAELREAQNHAMDVLPNVGVAVITDVGEEKDIHPRRKEPAGARLALAARHIAYGQDIVHSGPVFRSMKVKDGQAILKFDHTGGGLVVGQASPRVGETDAPRGTLNYLAVSGRLEPPLTGFAVCGKDRQWIWANASIEGNTVVVSHPSVPKPVAVRYGWADFPVANLWNAHGLPASPFRTDDFPRITAPKPAPKK
ncbi:MAG: hypothetical protein RJA22_2210 [Verrucomicrobiota bacterium]|jgi:sialate O-acetylesterase